MRLEQQTRPGSGTSQRPQSQAPSTPKSPQSRPSDADAFDSITRDAHPPPARRIGPGIERMPDSPGLESGRAVGEEAGQRQRRHAVLLQPPRGARPPLLQQ